MRNILCKSVLVFCCGFAFWGCSLPIGSFTCDSGQCNAVEWRTIQGEKVKFVGTGPLPTCKDNRCTAYILFRNQETGETFPVTDSYPEQARCIDADALVTNGVVLGCSERNSPSFKNALPGRQSDLVLD